MKERKKAAKDKEIEALWDELEDITMDEDANGELILPHDWRHFRKGTSRTKIWEWFATNHSKGITWLLYGREREDE